MSAAHDLKTIGLIDVLTSYKSICQEIEYFEVLLMEEEREYKRNRKTLIGGPTTKPSHLPIDRQIKGINDTISKHTAIEEILKRKRQLKKQAEIALSKFEGIEYQVAYKRFVEQKTLSQIADEENYSIDGIKKISRKINRALNGHPHIDNYII